jgi:hypothetical protein
MQGSGSVEPAREGNTDLLADGQGFENYGHGFPLKFTVLSSQFIVAIALA